MWRGVRAEEKRREARDECRVGREGVIVLVEWGDLEDRE